MEITWDEGRIWHGDCEVETHRSGIMVRRGKEETRTLFECLACGKRGWYPHGHSGPVCVDEVPNA